MVHEVLLSAPLVASMVISLALAFWAGLKGRLRVRKLFVVMTLAVAFLAVTYWFELLSTTLEEKLFCNGLEYIVNVIIPPTFLLFTMTFLDTRAPIGRIHPIALFIVPAAILLMVWTNEFHHLFYSYVGLNGGGRFTSFVHTYSVGFYIFTAYSLCLLLFSALLLSSAYLRSTRMHRRQIRPVLVAALLPLASLGLGFSGLIPLSLTYFFVIGFVAAGVLIFLGAFNYELFDAVPLAIETVVDEMDDGIVVADDAYRVAFANDTALGWSGQTEEEVYARSVERLFPALPRGVVQLAADGARVEVNLGRGEGRVHDLKVITLRDRNGRPSGMLLTLHDVTDMKRIGESLRLANTKLNLLSSITRHDILNQITVIRGYGEMLRIKKLKEEDLMRFGTSIVSAAEVIERQFLFARAYHGLGMKEPEWQKVADIFTSATTLGPGAGLHKDVRLDGVEVLGDPLLDRVFGILLDNTVRHAGGASGATVHYEMRGGELIIVYEDDGKGVPAEIKERIFEQGFGSSSGLGLYIARLILDVTEMSIRETGVEGRGARFEIAVPKGRWRISLADVPEEGLPD